MTIFSIVFLVLIVTSELIRTKSKLFDFLTIFNIFFTIFYVAPYLLFQFFPDAEAWNYAARYSVAYKSWTVIMVTFFSWCAVITGFGIARYSGRPENSMRIISPIMKENCFSAFILFLAFIITFMMVVTLIANGGVESYVKTAISRYSGEGKGEIYAYFNYFFGVAPLLGVITLDFCSSNKNLLNGFIFRACAALLLGLAILHALGTGGRSEIALAFAPFVVYWANKQKSSFLMHMKIILVSTIFLLVGMWYGVYGRHFLMVFESAGFSWELFSDLKLIGRGDNFGFLLEFFAESDHFNVGTFQVLTHPGIYEAPRVFVDYPLAILSLIPGVGPHSWNDWDILAALNRDAIGVNSGYVPVGYLANWISQGGVGMLFLWSAFGGYVGGKLDRMVATSPQHHGIGGVYLFIGFLWYEIFFHFDPVQIVKPLLGEYILLGILFVAFRLKVFQKKVYF